jgi:hypothetical protein
MFASAGGLLLGEDQKPQRPRPATLLATNRGGDKIQANMRWLNRTGLASDWQARSPTGLMIVRPQIRALASLGHILAGNRGHASTPYLALGVGVFSALAFSPAGVILGRNGAIVTYSAFLLALAIKMLTA